MEGLIEIPGDMETACDMLRASRKVLIVDHVKPDGDAVGSSLAIFTSMQKAGKECLVACADPLPRSSFFLRGSDSILIGSSIPAEFRPDLIVTVDCGSVSQIGAIYTENEQLFTTVPILNVDHHATTTMFGTCNIVDTTAAASAEVIFLLISHCGLPIDKDIATDLLYGIIMDSQGFRTSNTTARTLELAAELMQAGADLVSVNDASFREKPYSAQKLLGEVLQHMRRRGPIVWSAITRDMLAGTNAAEAESDGAINHMIDISGILVAALFKESDNGKIRVSLRSTPAVDIGTLAARMDGGGHRQAAGATLDGPLEKAEKLLIDAIADYLGV